MEGKDIIPLILSELNIKAPTFAKEIGLKYQRILDIQTGKTKKISPIVANAIIEKYPIFNRSWLLTGEGAMLNNASLPQISEEREFGSTGCLHIVPLLPISAQGGSFNDFVASIKENDCEKIVSPVMGADMAVTVTGDSMIPDYPSGSQVLIKKINEKAFIEWGKVYVLDTCNGTVIKKVNPGKDEGEITCLSINTAYMPFTVKMSDIYGMYRVIMCMSLK